MHPTRACERDFLRQHDVHQQVGGRAAVFLGKTDAQKSGRRRLLVHLPRKLTCLVPIVDVRDDLARDEAPHGLAERFVLVAQRGVRLHAGSNSTSSCPGETWMPAATCTALTLTGAGSESPCSIFIASSTTSRLPASKRSPAFAWTATTRPFIGAASRPSPTCPARFAGGARSVFSRR